jgi:hypothetical protein
MKNKGTHNKSKQLTWGLILFLTVAVALLNKNFFHPLSFLLHSTDSHFCALVRVTTTIMTGRVMLTFSYILSFAFLHSTGSPGIVLGKGDNKDGKGKSNKGTGMDYSEQLFCSCSLFLSFDRFTLPSHQVGPGRAGPGQDGLGHWVGSLGRVVGSGQVGLGRWVRLSRVGL